MTCLQVWCADVLVSPHVTLQSCSLRRTAFNCLMETSQAHASQCHHAVLLTQMSAKQVSHPKSTLCKHSTEKQPTLVLMTSPGCH